MARLLHAPSTGRSGSARKACSNAELGTGIAVGRSRCLRACDAPSRIAQLDGFTPGAYTLYQMRDDPVGDLRVNVHVRAVLFSVHDQNLHSSQRQSRPSRGPTAQDRSPRTWSRFNRRRRNLAAGPQRQWRTANPLRRARTASRTNIRDGRDRRGQTTRFHSLSRIRSRIHCDMQKAGPPREPACGMVKRAKPKFRPVTVSPEPPSGDRPPAG